MSFFGLFIIGAMLVGCGAMLSPAWPTREPRIGLAATLSLALVLGGAVFWAFLAGWDTLAVDYLLFLLVSGVVLGGTFSQGQMRAEQRGEELLDKDQGWPGPEDLVFFGLVGLVCATPLMLLVVPLSQDAAFLSQITLAVRDGGNFTSLAPYFPDQAIFTEPGFHAISAYLSEQLGQPVPQIHQVLGSMGAFLCVWAAYDLGGELQHKPLGRAFAMAALLILSISGLVLNGLYPQLLGILFGLAFTIYALRVYREALWLDVVGAGLMLGAILYVHVPLVIPALAGYAVFVLMALMQSSDVNYVLRIGSIPLVALAGTAPWLLQHVPDILQEITMSLNESVYGLLVPLIIAGGYGLFWIVQQLPQPIHDLARQRRYLGLGATGIAIVIGIVAALSFSFADQPTQDDLAAWAWLRDNTEPEAILLVQPDDVWTLPFAERPIISSNATSLDWANIDFVVKRSTDEALTMNEITPVFEQGTAIIYTTE